MILFQLLCSLCECCWKQWHGPVHVHHLRPPPDLRLTSAHGSTLQRPCPLCWPSGGCQLINERHTSGLWAVGRTKRTGPEEKLVLARRFCGLMAQDRLNGSPTRTRPYTHTHTLTLTHTAATDGHLICVLDKPLAHECSGVRAAASVCEVQHITGQRSAERHGYSGAWLMGKQA